MMIANFEIDMYGQLEIERNGQLKAQYCPKATPNGDRGRCGDWCPMFGEPFPIGNVKNEYTLVLCEGVRIDGEFKDERSKDAVR